LDLSYKFKSLTFGIECGVASGDEDIKDRKLTGFTTDPDFNVGLILYEKVLAFYTQRSQDFISKTGGIFPGIETISTDGGITNSIFFLPNFRFNFNRDFEFLIGFLYARGLKRFVDPYETDKNGGWEALGFNGAPASKELGWEIDLSIRYRIDKLIAELQTGYFKPGKVFSSNNEDIDKIISTEGRIIIEF